MKDTPAGWPRISTSLYYPDAGAAIDWLSEAFGFDVKMKVTGEDGRIVHSELTYGGGMVMVGEPRTERMTYSRHPAQVDGANTQNMMVYVDDVQAHHDRSIAAGAKITSPLDTVDYGPDHWSDRGYECVDLGGHHWWFFERLRTGGGGD